MNLIKILIEKKEKILEKWFDASIENYHKDTAKFLKQQKDPFANPVGSITYNSLDKIFDAMISDEEDNDIIKHLDNIIRVRAVQGFTPSDALSFIFSLKGIIKEEISEEIKKYPLVEDLGKFYDRIDSLILSAFDIYMGCREKIYDLKANELRNMTLKLIERANRIFELKYRKTDNSLNDKIERGEI